ncbi:hypothetical protein JCM3775_002508 [Rhodotorula graminis]
MPGSAAPAPAPAAPAPAPALAPPAPPAGPSPSSTRTAADPDDDPALPSGQPCSEAPGEKKKRRKERVVMLGHWHQRTWDFAAAMNATGALECFAAVSDLQDALVVLKAAIEPADVLVCSSYYDLDDVQERLLDYENDLNILVARPNQLNNDGLERTVQWVVDSIKRGLYAPKVKAALLTSSGYMRRLSETSARSGGGGEGGETGGV